MPLEYEPFEHIVIPIALTLIGFCAIKIICVIIGKTLTKTSLEPLLHRFIVRGFAVVSGIILIGTVLSNAGVPVTTIITMLGVAGAAIALALKDSLGNIAGGIIVIVSKPFKNGDIVEIGGVVGQVDQIDLIFTTIVTLDNKTVYIPNGTLSTSMIINYTAAGTRRVDCTFGISTYSSISRAKEILFEVASQNDMILPEPEPITGVSEHSSGIVYIDLKVWCAAENFLYVKYFLQENVKIAFDEAGIEPPAQQMNIQLKKQT